MRGERLRYYIHDEVDAFRLELSGDLTGDGAQDVYHAWRTALSIIGDRPVVVDMTFVSHADAAGRALLVLWRRHRARIVAGSTRSRELAESILGERFPAPQARAGFIQRIGARFRRRRTGESAGMSSGAGHSSGASAPPESQLSASAEVFDSDRLECRVH